MSVGVPLKRKADAISRLAVSNSLVTTTDESGRSFTISNASTTSTSTATAPSLLRITGRGSETGWTACPLCEAKQAKHKKHQKKFALGRGIAAHLQAVHAPWKQPLPPQQEPAAASLSSDARQEKLLGEDAKNIDDCQTGPANSKRQRRNGKSNTANDGSVATLARQPTQQEIDDWDAQVLKIVQDVEERALAAHCSPLGNTTASTTTTTSTTGMLGPGVDRTGHKVASYRASLPPFLQYAADGDKDGLDRLVQEALVAKDDDDDPGARVMKLLTTRDRHGSVAEHWAAGGGHISCLEYLVQLSQQYTSVKGDAAQPESKQQQQDASDNPVQVISKKMRRRDGKTSLHYAARSGHVHCIDFLLRERLYAVDVTSGDGTTPFHLACFGGHVDAARALLDHGANAAFANEWGCTAAHWLAMASTTEATNVEVYRDFCRLLQTLHVSFVQPQKQGHTAVHKAAQRKNTVMLKWLVESATIGGAGLSEEEKVAAGLQDIGGHLPSHIWSSAGGDSELAAWLAQMNW